MNFNDRVSAASSQQPGGSWKGGPSVATQIFGSAEEVSRLSKRLSEEASKVIREVQSKSFKSVREARILSQRELDQFVKQNLTATGRLKRAWSQTGIGGFLSNLRDYNRLMKEIQSGSGVSYKKALQVKQLSEDIGNYVTSQVAAAIKAISKKYADYARVYEQYLPSTSTNLGTDRYGYSSLLQSANQEIYNQGLSWSTSMKDVMASMDKLTSMGISSNLETLSVLESVSNKISTTWDVTSISDRLRRFGTDSGIYEYTLGGEAMLRDALQEQFGDSMYIQSGMYKTVRSMLAPLLNVQESAALSAEYEYAIQSGIGSLVEAGMSETSAQSIMESLAELAEKGYTTDTAALMAAANSGVDLSKFAEGTATNDDYYNLIRGYGGIFSQFQSDSPLYRGAIADALGLSAEDFAGNWDPNNIIAPIEDAGGMKEYMEQQADEVDERQSFYSNVENQLNVIIGLLGGNFGAMLGAGTISALGGGLSSVLGAAGGIVGGGGVLGKVISKLFGKSAKSSGTTGILSKGLGGVTGLGKGGWKSLSGIGKVATVAAGVGSLVSGVSNVVGATQNNTYSDNDAANAAAGFFLGNQSGDESVGGYMSAIGSQALSGAAAGAAIGSIIPGIGTLIGGLIGAAGGAILGGVGNKLAADRKSESTSASAASNSSNDGYTSILNSINSSINIQTDKLIAAIGNLYTLINSTSTSTTRRVTSTGAIRQ